MDMFLQLKEITTDGHGKSFHYKLKMIVLIFFDAKHFRIELLLQNVLILLKWNYIIQKRHTSLGQKHVLEIDTLVRYGFIVGYVGLNHNFLVKAKNKYKIQTYCLVTNS